jgi:spore germination protein YaaH
MSPLVLLIYLVNRPDSIASFRAHADRVSIVAPQTFSMDAQGFIQGEVPAEVLAIAREKRIAVMPLVVNRRFDQPLMHTVLDDPARRARAIRYLVYYALRDGYLGFQFDYENIHHTYRDKFTRFFQEAAREFHKHRLQLSIAVVGRQNDTRNDRSPGGWDNWSGVYDYARIGRFADFVSVMAYAEHGVTAAPGPVAGYPWVKRISEYSKSAMPARKISLGIPFYATRWDTPAGGQRRGRSARYRDVPASAEPQWDEERRSPHVEFEADGVRTELWFENARSLAVKLDLAREMHFRGVSAWVAGQEDPAFWESTGPIARVKNPLAEGSFEQRSKRAAARLKAARADVARVSAN